MQNVPDRVQKKIKEAEEEGLTELSLSYNKLTEIPESIFNLTKLKKLNLSSNRLTELPGSIAKLTNLTTLSLWNNKLTDIPESITKLTNLTRLDLSYNQLMKLPESIVNLTKLKELDLSNNPIKTPPPEIVNKGIDAIRDYFRQIKEKGEEYIYEAKLIIVGEPGAGKTTLSKKIQNPNYKLDEKEGTTRGIDVDKWSFPIENGKDFQVNLWDFGGQQIYHATHQFFLTKRSLYVLVSDNRREDADFHYWLNIVELLGGDSPLLIVQNEIQTRYREIDKKYYSGLFNNLKEVFDINLSKDLNKERAWTNILDSIKFQISHLDHIGNALPKTWAKVREKLENDPRNYMDFKEYLSICDENGIVRKEDKNQLSGYLHDIGVCLHFQDDPLLKGTLILKPEWATEAVYKILDDYDINRDYGRFNKQDVERICNDSIYDYMHDHLLRLMLNFQLCYEIPNSNGRYIAPQLLSVEKPDYDWDEKENIIIRYTYKFMPKGIISRFIVAMHEYIWCRGDQGDCVWKKGVVLAKDDTKAEIIENYEEREIKIRLVGKHKKELMDIINFQLDTIHKSFNRLEYKMLVPCNCSECKDSQNPYFFPFETLKKFEGNRKYEIQCQNSAEMVDVLVLINDFGGKEMPDGSKDEKAVFISYVNRDFDKAKKLYDDLTRNGINVWLNKMNLKPGDDWKYKIRKAIQNASFFIACFSEEYYKRDETFENEELVQALERVRMQVNKNWLIPVLLSDCKVPDIDIGAGKTLLNIQSTKLYENWNDNIQKIIDVIKKN